MDSIEKLHYYIDNGINHPDELIKLTDEIKREFVEANEITYQFTTGAKNVEAQAVDVFEELRETFAEKLPFDKFLHVERMWIELMWDNHMDIFREDA